MTPEMSFECLLVSRDPAVFCTMHRILEDFSIATNICLTTSRATELLQEGSPDLIVIDCDSELSSELVDGVLTSRPQQKPTILALAGDDRALPGVHVIARKPITRESATQSMRSAYSRMVTDFRKHVRYAVMANVEATDQRNNVLRLVVSNIGQGGVGLCTKERLVIGDILSFALALPGTLQTISIQARVLWTRQYGAAGCEFTAIPFRDAEILREWLTSRCRIKDPRINWKS
jgi:PilZ domain